MAAVGVLSHSGHLRPFLIPVMAQGTQVRGASAALDSCCLQSPVAQQQLALSGVRTWENLNLWTLNVFSSKDQPNLRLGDQMCCGSAFPLQGYR